MQTMFLVSRYLLSIVLGSIHFLEGGVGQRNSGEGHELFACPKREGRHKFDTTKRWVTINFTASRGRVTFFNTNNWC